MRYIIIIKFKNNTELVYRVKEEELVVMVNKVLWELIRDFVQSREV